MAKSIRSKTKRKNRAEFRRTIGEKAYQETMAKTQAKLKDCIERQSMNSIERLSSALGTAVEEPVAENEETPMIEAGETEPTVVDRRCENKVVATKRSWRRKHKVHAPSKTSSDKPLDKPKPRYYCEF